MFKNLYITGVFLYAITMLVFFIVYYFFAGPQYYSVSLNANAFLLPAIYALAAFFSVRHIWKRQKLNFKATFKRAFTPMFTGGMLSFLSIFAFLNFVDTDAKDMLNHQFVERNKKELSDVYLKEKARLKSDAEKTELEKDYRKSLKSFDESQVRGKDMFTFSHFSAYFAATLIFYLLLSLFFGAFFRSKSQ